MSAFRDASAALERAAALEEENAALHEELVKLRAEVERLGKQLEEANDDPANAAVAVRRANEERDALAREVKELREAAGVVAPGKAGPTVVSRLKAQLAAEREEARSRREERTTAMNEVVGERDALREELKRRNGMTKDLSVERNALRAELARVRGEAVPRDVEPEPPPDNLDAYMRRVHDERDELLVEVRTLRKAATQAKRDTTGGILSRLGRLLGR